MAVESDQDRLRIPGRGYVDLLARVCGEHLASRLGQSVVVENRTGAGGGLAAQAVKLAPADGYTLMMTISTTMLIKKVGRNDPCPCGSGKKYKKCCGLN